MGINKAIPFVGNRLSKQTKEKLKNNFKILDLYLFFRKHSDRAFKQKSVVQNFLKQKKRYLLVGCGLSGINDKYWLNTDLFHGKMFLDITKKHPFPNNSVDVVFHEHVFEHLTFPNKSLFALRESKRILKKGGVLRIGMPDFESYAKEYSKGTLKYNSPGKIHFTQTKQMEILNELFKQSGEHEFIYDFATVEFLLKKAGFSQVKKMSYNKSHLKGWKYDNWKEPSTMYVEAIK
jgi:predicted SAM-dependent methyltransferase